MAKLAQRRIPRTVVPISGPAEVGIEAVQNPNRFAKCAGQMRNRRIDADDEIEAVYESGRIGEVAEIAVPAGKVRFEIVEISFA